VLALVQKRKVFRGCNLTTILAVQELGNVNAVTVLISFMAPSSIAEQVNIQTTTIKSKQRNA
jgi:hypothetical protein